MRRTGSVVDSGTVEAAQVHIAKMSGFDSHTNHDLATAWVGLALKSHGQPEAQLQSFINFGFVVDEARSDR
jgi:hypothetical protein